MVLNFTLSDLKGLAVGPVAAQSSKGVWEKYSLLKCFHKDIVNVFFSQPFLNLDEKPDRLIVHLQETIAFILPWSKSTIFRPFIAILFWTRFGTHLMS